MQLKSDFIYGKLGKGSSFLVYEPGLNRYSVSDQLPMVNDYKPTEEEGLLWDFFKLFRAYKMYEEFLHTNEGYALFLEPYRTCNLKCSYCYAEPSWKSEEKLEYNRVKEIIDAYKIKDVRIFGGEPFLDSEGLIRLFEEYPGIRYFISSNGIAVNDKLVEALNKVCCTLQISLEPQEWKQRVNWNDVPQLDLLSSKWEILNKLNKRIVFRVTIPSDTDVPYVSLKEFVERIAKAKGDSNFILIVWPAFGKKLPSWFDKWIEEGHEILDDPILRSKFIDKHIWTTYLPRFEDFMQLPWYTVNCNAGIKSISMAPNGNLYACHEYAVVESDKYQIGKERIDKDEQFKVVSEYLNVINDKKICDTCDAKYLCGGICFAREIDSACEYMIKTIPIVLRWLGAANTRDILHWELKSKAFSEFIYTNKEALKEFFKESTWKQYYSGELPKEKVQELGCFLTTILQDKITK